MSTGDLSLVLEEVGLSSSGLYMCQGSLIPKDSIPADGDPGLGPTVFETKVKLQVHGETFFL